MGNGFSDILKGVYKRFVRDALESRKFTEFEVLGIATVDVLGM